MLPEVVDVHVHLCRTIEQEKLVFPRDGWPDAWYWGNPDNIIRYMDYWGVSHVVTVNIMDTERMIRSRLRPGEAQGEKKAGELREEMRDRVRSFNDWACDLHREQPRIVPFVMADPVLFGAQAAEEVERCLEAGAMGVKMHPTICGHLPDHPDALPIYELCSYKGVPILTDTTGRQARNGEVIGAPMNWHPVIRQFRQLQLILAHLCSERWDENLALAKEFRANLFFDIAGGFVDSGHPLGSHRAMPLSEGARAIRQIGVERVLFGSDGPAGREIADTVSQVLRLGLSEDECRLILHDNAANLLDLSSV